MNVERIVQIHIAVLASLGAMLLGMGQENSLLPALVVFAAFSSVVFTDVLNWFRVNRFVANVAMLLALFVSVGDFLNQDTRAQLLAIAHLLVYLQIASFYQRKNHRIYWHLMVFSLLQVVVSAALNVGVEFGVMLVAYVVTAISTLVFFSAHRDLSRFAGRGRARRSGKARGAARAGALWQPLLEQEMKAVPRPAAGRTSWRFLTRGLASQTVALGATTLVFSLVLFFSAPRHGDSAFRIRRSRATHVVGFSSELELDELADVLQSDDAVMRIAFRDAATGHPYRVFGDPYIRGAVLTEYAIDPDTGKATWRQRRRWNEELHARLHQVLQSAPFGLSFGLEREIDRILREPFSSGRLPPPPAGYPVVRQDIILEAIDEPVLFGVFPVYRIEQTSDDVRLNPRTRQVFSESRRATGRRAEYRYSLGTDAFRGGLQADITAHPNHLASHADYVWLAWELAESSRFDASRFPRLKQIADDIARKQRAAGADRATLAQALRDHFQDPERYTYSLDLGRVQRDPNLDPIEDFVANHHTGHCEYFASALVMMLRSQGIPARLVVGFKPGEYNEVGGYYQVLQRDAHAWVEAYVTADDVQRNVASDSYRSPAGGWLRLEPTLGAADDKATEYQRGWLDVADDVLDYARTLWTDYILGLTAKRQRESIYGPVSDQANQAGWTAFVERLAEQRKAVLGWVQRNVFSARGISMAVLLAALLAGARFLLRWLQPGVPRVVRAVRRWATRWTRSPGSNQATAAAEQVVKFYERFERLLRRLGLTRRPGQTAREFASLASERLAADPRVGSLDHLPTRVVDGYYHVRFGRQSLDDREVLAIEADLARLGDALRAKAQSHTEENDSR